MIKKLTAPNQPSMNSLVEWLLRDLSQILDIGPETIAAEEPLSRFGSKGVGLMYRLSAFLDGKLPVTLIWQYPTIESLAVHLAHGTESALGGSPPRSLTAAIPNEPIAVISRVSIDTRTGVFQCYAVWGGSDIADRGECS